MFLRDSSLTGDFGLAEAAPDLGDAVRFRYRFDGGGVDMQPAYIFIMTLF